MKCSLINFYICVFILFLFAVSVSAFNENEAKKMSMFSKYASCGKKPLTLTCPPCINPGGGFHMFFFYQYTRLHQYHYKFFIHYNDLLKQVVISFGGPSVDNYQYIQRIYSNRWSVIRLLNIRVESEFKFIYFTHLRGILLQKLNKIRASGRRDYRYIFTGYSLGGSLAILSAFDLTRAGVVSRHNSEVYTFGAMRIGDERFAAIINSTIRVWRIVKANDYMVRIPNCYYNRATNSWSCLTIPAIRRLIVTRSFPVPVLTYYRTYITHNRAVLVKLLRKAHITTQPQRRFSFKQIYATKYISPEIVPHGALTTRNRAYLVRTYLSNVYYTQPIGYQIYYNPQMTSFQKCVYVHGISSCERLYALPASFTSITHKIYYGINFEQC